MHAMQYELTLPADYDMGVIRDRVARVGRLLDDWDGLGLKAYLMRERGLRGSPVNQYAPFYLWNTVEGMNSFLWGGGFQRLGDDFGRPSVRQWTALAYEEGGGSQARFAVRHHRQVPDEGLLAEVVADAVGEAQRLAAEDGALLAATAVDTSRWELVHFSLWEHDTPKADGDVFEVLHLSAPGRDRLPQGRQW
ncbi:DUF4865 domain-containing protein [Streptomyces violarus]|uniref:DUF4865 domain-containing protein n=1 Tax=Streptomyces violarus TaxID=67380 RepID=A0A7W5F3E9_9ACTN|nr:MULTISPECIES: DUF4865 family protein [Streptomyces]MBB3078615.1 hypothetical protein [Streptomyces violarus]WRU03151.1 DUF4865 family protein [Streptomyces sp. CGMCC 4.1772]GHD05976.1 DUF4865 domain-containing protein [Streptomyces violarus]